MRVRFGRTWTNSFLKSLAKSVYLAKIVSFLASKNAIWASHAGCIIIFNLDLENWYNNKRLNIFI